MAKNIFTERNQYAEKRPRNTFDLSFTNHLSMKFGTLYPVFCKEVLPGDSFRIKSALGLQFMPMVFPVQTKMRAHMHFFYVRNRTLWKDWIDYIFKTKDNLVPPYIALKSTTSSFWKTGSLSDYLGIPTTSIGKVNDTVLLLPQGVAKAPIDAADFRFDGNAEYKFLGQNIHNPTAITISASNTANLKTGQYRSYSYYFNSQVAITSNPTNSVINRMYKDIITGIKPEGSYVYPCVAFPQPIDFELDETPVTTSPDKWYVKLVGTNIPNVSSAKAMLAVFVSPNRGGVQNAIWNYTFGANNFTVSGAVASFEMSLTGIQTINTLVRNGHNVYLALVFHDGKYIPHTNLPEYVDYNNTSESQGTPLTGYTYGALQLKRKYPLSSVVSITDNSGYYNPFCNSSDGAIFPSSLPYRAYQAVFNSFYRNQQNNPFTINGVPEYNKWITTNEGGADETPYELYQRDWEKDFLTSAVQSPQQGIAPLVGLITKVDPLGRVTLKNADDGTTAHVQFEFAEDGETVTSFHATDPNLHPTTGQILMDSITQTMGLSINDLRQTNSLMRWLETNLRRGYRYRDLLKGQYDVEPKYDELDMPEFIGGWSQTVTMSSVLNQSAQGAPLGDIAGHATLFGEQQNDITHFCDEHGFIMGILSVVPTPSYSQLLPKHFLKTTSPLDYYFPEFGKIGMQPILYEEVAPINVFQAEKDKGESGDISGTLKSTFGYQRAWYDYIGSVDELHGEMRTSLRNFVMNRIFEGVPQLGKSFIEVDPEQCNDVFAVNSDTDKIVGQVVFNVEAKREIPRMGIPALE